MRYRASEGTLWDDTATLKPGKRCPTCCSCMVFRGSSRRMGGNVCDQCALSVRVTILLAAPLACCSSAG